MNNRQRKKQKVKNQNKQKMEEQKNDKKETVKFGLEKIGIIASIAACVIAFLSFVTYIFDIRNPIYRKPDLEISNEIISVEYLRKSSISNLDIYHLFQDAIADSDNNSINKKIIVEYLENKATDDGELYPIFQDSIGEANDDLFKDSCATQVFITNNYEDEILLDKIIFEAQDITINTEPVIGFWESKCTETEIELSIFNKGWGDANNIVLEFEDMNNDIDEYLIEEKQSVEIPVLKYGEEQNIQIWKNTDFLKDGVYSIKVSCKDEKGGIDIDNGYEGGEYIRIEVRDGKFFPPGLGSSGSVIYAIKIDTSSDNYSRNEAISESIKAHERLELPICFSADKSCNLNFRIGFEVVKKHNEKEIIWTELANLDLRIPSINFVVRDVLDYKKEELYKEATASPETIIVTYPYVDKEVYEYVQSPFIF